MIKELAIYHNRRKKRRRRPTRRRKRKKRKEGRRKVGRKIELNLIRNMQELYK